MQTLYRFATASLLSLFAACSPTIYVPETPVTPLFRKSGDMQASVHVGTSGYGIHLAGSPISHVGITAATSWYRRAGAEDSSSGHESHRMYDIALVGYLPNRRGANVELSLGYGTGSARAYGSYLPNLLSPPRDGQQTYAVDADYRRYMLQLTIGENNGELNDDDPIFETGFSLRAGIIEFTRFVEDDSLLSLPPRGLLLDAMGYIRYGPPAFRIGGQFGVSQKLDVRGTFDTRLLFLSIGAHLMIDRISF